MKNAAAPAPTPTMQQIGTTFVDASSEFRAQSLNAIVAGFSFASAIAWLDLVRFLVKMVITVPKNGSAQSFLLTAVFTTVLSIVVYLVVSRLSKDIVKPKAPVYALTR